jgi:hypothetical protein
MASLRSSDESEVGADGTFKLREPLLVLRQVQGPVEVVHP